MEHLLLLLLLLSSNFSTARRNKKSKVFNRYEKNGGWDECGLMPNEPNTTIYIYEWPTSTSFVPPTAHEIKRGD